MEEYDEFDDGIHVNSTTVEESNALDKLRQDLEIANQNENILKSDIKEKEEIIAKALADKDILKENKEVLEKKLKLCSATLRSLIKEKEGKIQTKTQ